MGSEGGGPGVFCVCVCGAAFWRSLLFSLLSTFRVGSMGWENLVLLSQLAGFEVGGGSVV